MTDAPATDTLHGDVLEGHIGDLASSFYTGPCGYRTKRNGVLEISYAGERPDGDQAKAEAKLDGNAITILTADKGINRGMVVLTAALVGEDN